MENPFDNRIQTVSELTRSIRGLLETSYSMVTVTGEISNLRRPSSGHLYFTLKDADAQLRAVLFRAQQRYLACTPADGLEVLCRGRISVYEPRGEYQLIIDFMDGKGAGLLRIAFDRLKAKLEAEGLFAPERKRPLPFLPKSIALVTSPQGAAVRDFLTQAAKRCPATAISIMPVRVQGDGAAAEIAQAIARLNQLARWDVIVLCRGGGSLEDLWAFNEEELARAVAASEIPVVSAVGHEVDFTIADFVADLRAPTPTAAAQMVLPDQEALAGAINEFNRRLAATLRRQLQEARQKLLAGQRLLGDPSRLLAQHHLRLDHLQAELGHGLRYHLHRCQERLNRFQAILQQRDPRRELARQRDRLQAGVMRLNFTINSIMVEKRNHLGRNAAILDAVSPLAVLGRGYAIARRTDGTVLRSARQAEIDEELSLILHDGQLSCNVKQIKPQ
ncbi:exodeoxyribonuclease VII large subunit [Desulfurivibrio alkaliphilus]|uniref:Exodeoxyribonuclease 7 large subunit n=1 Tax=Desulfurivibrio alkaliphilus (strain DSM 19089 / UNIQEM U267 / AHT2) TaxID=589865 RepID=D6Z1G8_DESAT|nr:exodeoxyribonuclease VII large subunit [Desulfurivibrio alkaliphilus]ADH85423.1 exodeoxyribonuclease VII, large subunit [Desulfurivibrio alkaliphilus AHT 2]